MFKVIGNNVLGEQYGKLHAKRGAIARSAAPRDYTPYWPTNNQRNRQQQMSGGVWLLVFGTKIFS